MAGGPGVVTYHLHDLILEDGDFGGPRIPQTDANIGNLLEGGGW